MAAFGAQASVISDAVPLLNTPSKHLLEKMLGVLGLWDRAYSSECLPISQFMLCSWRSPIQVSKKQAGHQV